MSQLAGPPRQYFWSPGHHGPLHLVFADAAQLGAVRAEVKVVNLLLVGGEVMDLGEVALL